MGVSATNEYFTSYDLELEQEIGTQDPYFVVAEWFYGNTPETWNVFPFLPFCRANNVVLPRAVSSMTTVYYY